MFIFANITNYSRENIMTDFQRETNDREEIITEMGKHNILEKIVEELSKLIEKKEYDRELGRN